MKKTLNTVFLVLFVIGAAAITGVQAPVGPDTYVTQTLPSDPMFIKFDGIDGESKDNAHRDWIDLLSFQFGISRPSSVTRVSSMYNSYYVTTNDISIVKYVDKSSPKLLDALTSGTMIGMVQLDFTRVGAGGGSVTYLVYELQDVQITSYHVSMSSGDPLPVEEISFNYGKITVTYTEIDEMGQAEGDVEWSYIVTRGTVKQGPR